MEGKSVPPRILSFREWSINRPVDYVLVIVLLVSSGLLSEFGRPHCRTFQWTDATINFPPHADTFPVYSLFLMGVFSVVLFIVFYLFLVRLLRWLIPSYGHCCASLCPSLKQRFFLNGLSQPPTFLHSRMWNVTSGPVFSWLLALFFSLSLELFCTTVLKLYVGRPRPDFLSRLAAHGYTSTTEKDPLSGEKVPDPHTDPQFFCDLGNKITSMPSLSDGRLSFPSGHSSTSFGICTVVAFFFFFHLRPFAYQGSFFRLCLALSPFWICIFCAASRTRDNKHHYSDVLAGSIIGLASGLLAVNLCFRTSGGPSMVFLARADNDVEYVKREQLNGIVGRSESNVLVGRRTSSYMGTNLVSEAMEEETGNVFATPRTEIDDGSTVNRNNFSRSTRAVIFRNPQPGSAEEPPYTEMDGVVSAQLPSPVCLVAIEKELNESSSAVPWI